MVISLYAADLAGQAPGADAVLIASQEGSERRVANGRAAEEQAAKGRVAKERSAKGRASNDSSTDSSNGAGTIVLGSKEVEQLPDDPDDLLQELQMLASTSGGDLTATSVVVDGFQGSSAMPPKSSIASIRINPDSFSPEFQWHRSRVEITTKPGADKLHGALFFTDSNSIFNATDPFSTTSTPAGRQRYGV